MKSGLGLLDRHAAWFLAGSIFLALALPDLASLMRPLLAPSVWGILVLAMLRTDWALFRGHSRRTKLVAATLAWLLLVSPLAIWAIAWALGVEADGLGRAVILAAAAPPLMSTPALAMIIGLDGALALLVMVAAMFLAPLILPVITLGLLGIAIDISLMELAARLLGMVGSALAVSFMLRRYLGSAAMERVSGNVNGMVVVLMLVFAVAIMDGVTARLLDEPLHVLLVLALSFLFQALLQGVTAVCFMGLGRRGAYTVAFVAGNRNMGLLLAVLPAGLHPDILLYFAMAQFPIYMLPALLKPLYGKLLPVK